MGSLLQGDLGQSLVVTAAGMGLVFASLGGLMLIILGLQRVFREQPAAAPSGPPRMVRPLPEVTVEADAEGEAVVAIAVALAVLRQREEALPPPKTTVVTFAPGTGAWQALGRLS